MILSLVATVLIASLALVVGLPFAMSRRGSRGSLSILVFDSMLMGTAAIVVAGSLFTWSGWSALLPLAAATACIAALGIRELGRPDLTAFRPEVTRYTVCVGLLLAIGMALRLQTVDFVHWAGDMGQYVNAANQFAEWGHFGLGFPPGFAIYLTVPARLIGVDATTASVPFLGFLLIGAVLRIAGQLRLEPLARLVALGLATFSFVAVWYSSFPVSEALQAPLTMLVISIAASTFDLGNDRKGAIGEFLCFALASMALGFTRGTGPLLILPLLVVLVSCCAPSWRRYGSRAAALCAAGTIGLGTAYLYGVDRIPKYFVDTQIASLLPSGVFDLLERARLLEPSPVLIAGWVLAIGALLVVRLAFDRWTKRASATHRPTDGGRSRWPLPLTAVIATSVAAGLVIEGGGEITAQLTRMGLVLLIVGLAALLLPGSVAGARGPTLLIASILLFLMFAIQLTRFDGARAHSFFIYWDRYLFSESFPVLVVLCATAVGVSLEWSQRRAADGRHSTRAVRLACEATGVALLVGFSISQINGLVLVRQHAAFDGTAEFYADLVALLPDDDVPLMWTGSGAQSESWPIFPNSWHSFGRPLIATYGREVMNFPPASTPFVPDPVLDAPNTELLLACTPDTEAYVIEFRRTAPSDFDARLSGSAIDVTDAGWIEADVPILRHLDRKDWEWMRLSAHVWRITADPGSLPDCPFPGMPRN